MKVYLAVGISKPTCPVVDENKNSFIRYKSLGS